MRLSDHNLPIERGRRNNIERNKRFCTNCKSNEIGNEEHVLFECHNEELTKLRFKFIAQLLLISPQLKYFSSENKLKYILGMYDDSINVIVGNYLMNILKIY